MSLLLSDSLMGIVNESDLVDEEVICGIIKIVGVSYEIDSFLSDGKVIRVHAAAELEDAIRLLAMKEGITGEIVMGEKQFIATGKILQVGWEKLPHGNRLIISMNVRDK